MIIISSLRLPISKISPHCVYFSIKRDPLGTSQNIDMIDLIFSLKNGCCVNSQRQKSTTHCFAIGKIGKFFTSKSNLIEISRSNYHLCCSNALCIIMRNWWNERKRFWEYNDVDNLISIVEHTNRNMQICNVHCRLITNQLPFLSCVSCEEKKTAIVKKPIGPWQKWTWNDWEKCRWKIKRRWENWIKNLFDQTSKSSQSICN